MTVRMARNSLVTLRPFYTLMEPLANEVPPPTKSSMMLNMDHPLVDFLFQFQYTAGLYLTKLITNFPYPRTDTGFQYSVHSMAWMTLIINIVT